MPRERLARYIALLTLFAAGAGLCLWYGRLGFMALDQSIVFDGGWRVVSGQRPYSDFQLPSGLVPILIQAAFFMLLGVSWWTYVLHAAIVNGLFGIVVWATLRSAGARPFHAWVFGLLSTVVFYPPFGVPYPDQHSFFFAACCLLATMRAWHIKGPPAAPVALAVVCGTLAALSKPVPAAFVVIPCGVAILLLLPVSRRPSAARALVFSLLAVFATMAAYLVLADGRADDAVYYGLYLPLHTVHDRSTLGAAFLKTLIGVLSIDLWTLYLVQGVGLVAIATAVNARGDSVRVARRGVSLWLLAEGMLVVCLLFAFVTNNQVVNGWAYLFLAGGLALTAATTAIESGAWAGTPAATRRAASAVALVAIGVGIADGWRFNRFVNRTRIVQDQSFDAQAPRWSPGGRLAFMTLNDHWRTPDPRPILEYICARPDNFLLLGDSSILYGVTGHPSVSPALWFHPGLSMPMPGTARFTDFERRLDARLARYDVRYVILESRRTWMAASLKTLPHVETRTTGCPWRRVGDWAVVEICR